MVSLSEASRGRVAMSTPARAGAAGIAVSTRKVSLGEARGGHAAEVTASRKGLKGEIVGESIGSRYVREQEEKAKKQFGLSESEIRTRQSIQAGLKDLIETGVIKTEKGKEIARRQVKRDTVDLQNSIIKLYTNPTNIQNQNRLNQSVRNLSYSGSIYNTQYNIPSETRLLYNIGKKLAKNENLTAQELNIIKKYSTKFGEPSKPIKYISGATSKISTGISKYTFREPVEIATADVPVIGAVVRGGYMVADFPKALGEALEGFERWAREPSIIAPSIPIGAGATVGMIEADPIAAVSNILVTHGIGKGIGKITPVNVKKLGVQEVKFGETTKVKDIGAGYGITVGKKPILSVSGKKITLGAPKVPKEVIAGKDIQVFTKENVKVFEETLKQFEPIEYEYFKAGKTIAEKSYRQPKPITKPQQLEILSENVPPKMKAVTKDTIVKYGGLFKTRDIKVYGSVSQKLQMEGFFTRTPKDIEVSVSNVKRFISDFRKNANKAGFKEGIDYKITGNEYAPKIEFKINNQWEKGIEVFSKKKTARSLTDSAEGYKVESDIAYGYKIKKPIKVGKPLSRTKLMKLQEQAARKFEGATVLREGRIEPKYIGRVKDIRDLIEIGTAYEVTNKLGIATDIIKYAKISAKRQPSILQSPIVKYIVENGKLPTKTEILKMTEGETKTVNPIVDSVNTPRELEIVFSSDRLSISRSISRAITEGKEINPITVTASNLNSVSRSVSMFEKSMSIEVSKIPSRQISKPMKSTKVVTPSKIIPSKPIQKAESVPISSIPIPNGKSVPISTDITSTKSTSLISKAISQLPISTEEKQISRIAKQKPIIPLKGKKKKREPIDKYILDFSEAFRVHKNVLGSLESVLGGGTKKKSKRKVSS